MALEKYLKYQVLNELLSSTIEATEESSEENSSLSLLKKVLDTLIFILSNTMML